MGYNNEKTKTNPPLFVSKGRRLLERAFQFREGREI